MNKLSGSNSSVRISLDIFPVVVCKQCFPRYSTQALLLDCCSRQGFREEVPLSSPFPFPVFLLTQMSLVEQKDIFFLQLKTEKY